MSSVGKNDQKCPSSLVHQYLYSHFVTVYDARMCACAQAKCEVQCASHIVGSGSDTNHLSDHFK